MSFLEAMKTAKEEPVIIIISSAIVSEWRGTKHYTRFLKTSNIFRRNIQNLSLHAGVLYLTNFPATRFYINLNHPAVEDLRTR